MVVALVEPKTQQRNINPVLKAEIVKRGRGIKMKISDYSVLMTLLWGNMAILFLYFGIKRRKFIHHFGIKYLLLIYLLCAVRLLVPVEFPYTKIISFRGTFSHLYEFLFLNEITLGNIKTFPAMIIFYISSCVSIFSVLIVFLRYRSVNKLLYSISKERSLEGEKALENIQKNKKKFPIEIWESPCINVPMAIGIFRKKILLPQNNYTHLQMQYILTHEYTHFLNNDLIVKMLLQIFCGIFWWNPCAYLLKKEIDNLLEVKCDLTVTKNMVVDEITLYLQTIISVIQDIQRKQQKNTAFTMSLFNKNKSSFIIERFHLVSDAYKLQQKDKKNKFHFGMITVLSILMVASYTIQLQGGFDPLESELPSQEAITPENTFLIKNTDGTFTLVDKFNQEPDVLLNEEWIIKDFISQGFHVIERNDIK